MSAISRQALDGLNPFPGYPVVSIGGVPERTIVTQEIGNSREIVRDFVAQWRPAEIDENEKALRSVERPFVVLISGDYGTGKTHLMVDCANFLKDEFAQHGIRESVIIRVSALGTTPSGWYRDMLGVALDSHGERTADGGWFTRLILQVYSMAAKSLLLNQAIKTDSLHYQPDVAMRLVSEGLLNATAVWTAFEAILRQCCARAPDTVRDHFIALMNRPSRAQSERWLAGGDNNNEPSDQEAAGILAASVALCRVVRWPFALFIDEIEQFLRKDDHSGSEVNTTWLKRLLADLAEAGAFIAVGGHVSAWARRRDFLDRFSGGTRRIDMARLNGADVLAQVAGRVGPDTAFGPAQADCVADVCNGNMRRVLALCRVLYDRSGMFSVPLSGQDIRDRSLELGHALTRDQALLNIREAFETRGFAVYQELKDGGVRFDLVARGSGGTVFVVIVRSTPEVKEAQDLAIQFVRQINANRQSGEHVRAIFACDTPEDRGLQQALRDSPEIDFVWINYTDLDAPLVIIRTIDGDVGKPSAGTSPPSAVADVSDQLEAAINKRLDELDRQRGSELSALYERLANAERRAAAEPEKKMVYVASPQFSAADLLTKPSLNFRFRALMSSTASWLETILLVFGLLVASISSRLPSIWLQHVPIGLNNFSSEGRSAVDDYSRAADAMSFNFLVGGIVIVVVTGALLFRRYLAVESYFDYANQLIKEEYLSAPHPWLLAGANRITQQLALIYSPAEGMRRLQGEIENLVGKRTAMPRPPTSSPSD